MFQIDFRISPDLQPFPLLKLPTVVLIQVVTYLSAREKRTLAQVNSFLRDQLNHPQLWKNTTFVVSPKKVSQCHDIANLLRQRKAHSIRIAKTGNKKIHQAILKGLPDLQSLAIDSPSPSTLGYIANSCKDLKKLYLGRLSTENTSDLCKTFRKLDKLVDVTLSRRCTNCEHHERCMDEIKAALCCHGTLYRLGLELFSLVDLKWLWDIIQKNPNLQMLKLHFVGAFDIFAFNKNIFLNGLRILQQTCALKELRVGGSLKYNWIITNSLEWLDEFPVLEHLDVSFTMDERMVRAVLQNLHKFTGLKKLTLICCSVTNDMFCENFPKLNRLQLDCCHKVSCEGLKTVALAMGNSLNYLGLNNCSRLQDSDVLGPLLDMPVLNTLDLSGTNVSDALLQEFYINDPKAGIFHGPKKILLRGCKNISKEMVLLVRQKMANKIIVDI